MTKVIDIQELAKELGLPTWETWSERFEYHEAYKYAYDEAYNEAINAGFSPARAIEEGEAAGQRAEEEQQTEEFNRYYDNLMRVAEEVFEEHGLALVPGAQGWQVADDLDGLRKKRR